MAKDTLTDPIASGLCPDSSLYLALNESIALYNHKRRNYSGSIMIPIGVIRKFLNNMVLNALKIF